MESISYIIEQVVDFMVSFGPVGGFILVILESILPPLPLGVIVVLNMLSFGKLFGFIMSYIATIIGCMGSFMLFRYFFKDKFVHKFKKENQEKIKKWKKRLTNIDFNALTVIIALPATPAFLLNIAAGLSDISFRKYFVASLIGKPIMLAFYAYIGIEFVDSLKDPMNFLKIIGLLLIAYIISKIIEKIVKVE